MNEPGVRVHVETNYAMHGVNIVVLHTLGDGRASIRSADGGAVIVGPEATNMSIEPTVRLRDDEALALLEALLNHYRGGSDVRQLRADYTAERKRVDKLLDHLIGVRP